MSDSTSGCTRRSGCWKYVICKYGDTRAETTRVALERGNTVLVVRRVPAQVCESCGEAYIDANAFDRLQAMLDEATGAGIQVEVREYAAA